jgi:hypothetical protein
MAVKTVQTLAERKAERDELFRAGTKAQRTALMSENGLRAAREAKGYGRAAVAKALKISPADWWLAEFVFVAGSPEHKAMQTRIAGLPSIKKGGTPAPDTTTKAKAKAAPKATTKAKAKVPDSVPPNATDVL